MVCKKCGKELSENEVDCPNCEEASEIDSVGRAGNVKPKSNKKIVFIVIGIIIVITIGLSVLKGIASVVIDGLNEFVGSIDSGVIKKLELEGLKLEYNSSWKEEENTNSNTKSISKGSVRLALTYSKSNVYYSTYTFVSEMIREYENSWEDFTTVSGIENIAINDNEWAQIEFLATVNGEDRKGLQLFFSTGYELYSIVYVSREKDYNTYIDEVNKILETAYVDNSREANSVDVKQKILGEWDCGDTGYLVINNDNTYDFYKDSSKSTDNVISGTYECSDGIATYAAGYADGITFITTIKKQTINGEDIETSGEAKIQYAFTPDGTDGMNYDGKNINVGSTFKMKKIK